MRTTNSEIANLTDGLSTRKTPSIENDAIKVRRSLSALHDRSAALERFILDIAKLSTTKEMGESYEDDGKMLDSLIHGARELLDLEPANERGAK